MTAVDAKQIELMRRASRQQLSDEVLALSRRAIARSFPELDHRQQALELTELHYADDAM